MTDRQLTIPKTPELHASENYALLRTEGLNYIERLSGKIWTDYNTHDPGITIMELLSYAITDLGYRTSFPVEDLLALPADEVSIDKNFLTAADVLPVNPTTETDLRKLIIDVKGVKNAWISTAKTSEAPVYIDSNNGDLTNNPDFATALLPLNGLFNVLLEYEVPGDGKEESELTADERLIRANTKEQIRQDVHATVMAHRNLCEDLVGISEVSINEISICADIEVRQNADINLVMAKIYQIAINYCSPSLNFYTLEELLDKGKSTDEIFEGPLLKYGFLDSDEVENANLREELHSSDLINSIMDIEDVIAVRGFKLMRFEDGVLAEIQPWKIQLTEGHAAQFSRLKSKLLFYKGLLPFMASQEEVLVELNRLQQSSGRFRKTGQSMDIEVPTGTYRELQDYFPVQNDFPLVYGIGQTGLPESAGAERLAQAKQLKAYLLFFEQLLTNYLAQLANVGRLFSSRETVDRRTLTITGRSYYTQLLTDYASDPENGIADLNQLQNFGDYQEELEKLVEDQAVFSDRRNRFLDHLLARFCESMANYSLILFHQMGKEEGGLRLIADKESFLRDYSLLSRDRGRAFNYRKRLANNPLQPDAWNTTNISGLKVRIARLLGMSGVPVEDEDDSNLRVVSTEPNKWRVHLVSNTGVVLLDTLNFPTADLAKKQYHHIRESGMLESSFEKAASGGLWYIYLNDIADSSKDIAFQSFATEAERDAALAQAKALLKEDIIIDRIRRRNIATNLFVIESGLVENPEDPTGPKITMWWVRMIDPDAPADPNKYLLKTRPEDSRECAESHLLFLLHSGDEEERYQLIQDANGHHYAIFNDCYDINDAKTDNDGPMAVGMDLASAELRNKTLTRLLFLFRDQCDIEDFHLLEHILLRPRIAKNTVIPFEQVLPACQHQQNTPLWSLNAAFSVEFVRNTSIVKKATKTTKSKSKKATPVLDIVNQEYLLVIWQKNADGSTTKIAESKKALDAIGCRELWGRIRRRGMSISNFSVQAPLVNPNDPFTFTLTPGGDPNEKANTTLLFSSKIYATEADAKKDIEAVANWLAYKESWWSNYLPESCEIPDDPYSFRMSFILPAWPTRFRSSYFRQFIEQTIREETPAHIYVKICWVGLQQMRDYEKVYQPWLESLNLNEYPEAALTNAMITELGKLYNVYPTAILHSCDDISADEPQMILDQTTLGNQ